MGEVVFLAESRARRHNPVEQSAVQYWESLAQGGVPVRDAVNPREMAGVLAHVAFVEFVAPGHGRLQVAGQAFSELLGVNARGLPMSVFFRPHHRPELERILQAVAARPSRAHLLVGSPKSIGRPALSGSLTILPLADDKNTITGALVALSIAEQPLGRAPRRLDINGSFVRRVGLDRSPRRN